MRRQGCLGRYDRLTGSAGASAHRSARASAAGMDCQVEPRTVRFSPGMTGCSSRSMAEFGSPVRPGDVNRMSTSRGHEFFGWSMRPWESMPATPRAAADSQSRMDPAIATDYGPFTGKKVNGTPPVLGSGLWLPRSIHVWGPQDCRMIRGMSSRLSGSGPGTIWDVLPSALRSSVRSVTAVPRPQG
jgi:hypothetical protein